MKQYSTLLPFVLCFVTSMFFGQSYSILYKVSYRPVADVKKRKTEYMMLEVDNFKSRFFSQDQKKLDSMVQANDPALSDSYELPNLKFEVYKDLSGKKSLVSADFNGATYIYEEPAPAYELVKTSPGKLENYWIKQAWTNAGGREWAIFYTEDVPLFVGPYLFSGLPGMVYKAISSDMDYEITFVGIQKSTKTKEIKLPKTNITKERYSKQIKEFLENPGHHSIMYKNIWGDTFHYNFKTSSPAVIKQQEELMKKITSKFNNPIDKEMYLFDIIVP